ncbi:MAG: uracil-DNA glycosylase [Deltaproteobacteria bacterium]|nr:MAG: uracil-DNA glycosylase [Deltaproteobacteria bacterium]RLB79142.1 MAG: uracil-DNA glycosylase [Deltaproteobacteria bacterium]
MNRPSGKNSRPTFAPKKVSCFTCRHFYITHRPPHAYGCKAMGFKSSRLPSHVVFSTSGIPCQAYSKKNKSL